MDYIKNNPFFELPLKEARELLWKIDFLYDENDEIRFSIHRKFYFYFMNLGGTKSYDHYRNQAKEDIDSLPF